MSSTGSRFLRLLITAVAILVLFVFTWGLMTWAAVRYDQHRMTVPVGSKIPSDFPVLVVVSGDTPGSYNAHIIPQYWLGSYRRANPSCSFVVPSGKENELNEQIDKWVDFNEQTHEFGRGKFSVRRLSGGRQQIRLEWHGEDTDRIGWYTAVAESFRPKHYVSYRPGRLAAFVEGPVCFIVNTVAWTVGYVLYRRRKRSRLGH